jgi:hypothetical protein
MRPSPTCRGPTRCAATRTSPTTTTSGTRSGAAWRDAPSTGGGRRALRSGIPGCASSTRRPSTSPSSRRPVR